MHDISYANLLMLGATVPDYSLDDDETTVVSGFGEGPVDDSPSVIEKTEKVLDFFS